MHIYMCVMGGSYHWGSASGPYPMYSFRERFKEVENYDTITNFILVSDDELPTRAATYIQAQPITQAYDMWIRKDEKKGILVWGCLTPSRYEGSPGLISGNVADRSPCYWIRRRNNVHEQIGGKSQFVHRNQLTIRPVENHL